MGGVELTRFTYYDADGREIDPRVNPEKVPDIRSLGYELKIASPARSDLRQIVELTRDHIRLTNR